MLPHDNAVASYDWLGLRRRALAWCPLLWGEVGLHYTLDLATLVWYHVLTSRSLETSLGAGSDIVALIHWLRHQCIRARPAQTRSGHHAPKGTLLVPSGPIALSKRPTPVWPRPDTRVCSSLWPCVTWERHAQIKTWSPSVLWLTHSHRTVISPLFPPFPLSRIPMFIDN